MKTYKDIQYQLKRSDRKTASIYIERNGEVSLLVPNGLDDQQVEGLIEGKLRWIYKGLAEWKDLNATQVHREFVNGQGFPYLGRSYRLKIVPGDQTLVSLDDDYFLLKLNDQSKPDIPSLFKSFYRRKGLELIPDRMSPYATAMNVSPKSIRVQELQNRWGSCTPNGDIVFHWKSLMAPLTILDYVIVHELAHLIHKNHTAEFWKEIEKALPDYRERKQWLRENGASLSF